jgi:DUF917 family protein
MELQFNQVEDLCMGAALLGAGGGGDPYLGGLMVKRELAAGRKIKIVDPQDVPDDALILPTAMMGAPTVLLEKIPSGEEVLTAFGRLQEYLGERAWGTMPTEVGGINSTIPLFVGARCGVPIIDADGQGRAFPELQMETFAIEGVAGTPMTIANEQGDFVVISTDSHSRMENIARVITIRFGGTAYFSNYPMRGHEVRRASVHNTLSLALALGHIIHNARVQHQDPFEELLRHLFEKSSYKGGRVIFSGKVVDVRRETRAGFMWGTIRIEGLKPHLGECQLEFQNENLIASCDGELLAIVPDIIAILDAETSVPITNETLRFGQRVKVMAITVPDIMSSPKALNQFGPQAFGLKESYRPATN